VDKVVEGVAGGIARSAADNDQRLLGIVHLHDLWGTEMV